MAELQIQVEDPAAEAPAPKPTKKPKIAPEAEAPKLSSNAISLTAVGGFSLVEPYLLIWFHPNRPVPVENITKWMQAQIDAGLLKRD
jgi:hypothetical protein